MIIRTSHERESESAEKLSQYGRILARQGGEFEVAPYGSEDYWILQELADRHGWEVVSCPQCGYEFDIGDILQEGDVCGDCYGND